MGIVTGKGDDGKTDIYRRGKIVRASKSNLVFDVMGDIDELSSHIGVTKNYSKIEFKEILERIQADLVMVGGMVAGNPGASISEKEIARIDKYIDSIEGDLGELKGFVYPGGSEASARLDVCRSVCRRAERSAAKVKKPIPIVLKYLNRLSDLLFLMARAENKDREIEEKGN
jgi:cob(I)alamin adenosyltransferase